MKKYVWLLAIAAFAVAVLAMVGCRPAETPTPSPSPTPQPTPTPDTRCPQPVSTVVRDLYITGEGDPGDVKIVITFDEPIAGDVDCIENLRYWTVTVKNDTRYGEAEVTVDEVTLSDDGKKITITAIVTEDFGDDDVSDFYGLICDEDSAKAYRDALEVEDGKAPDGSSVSKYAKVADLVHWKLSAWCTVYDDLGNACCGFEGEACCSPVCEPVTPPSGCPL